MNRKKLLRRLAAGLAAGLCAALGGITALADEEPVYEAKIGETLYETLDDALAAAADGDTIELLADCETQLGVGLSGTALTIQGGGHTVTFPKKGIYLVKRTNPAELTFDGCGIVMDPAEGTAVVRNEGYSWASIVINFDCVLNFKDSTLTLSASETTPKVGFYYHEGSKINLDASTVTVTNLQSNAFSADVADQGLPYTSELNILNGSRLETSGCYAGLTAALQITVDDSVLIDSNQRGNASNGADYIIKNSTVDISGNGGNGMSARNIYVESSVLTCNDNGLRGIIFYGTAEFIDSDVTITGTVGKSYWCAGLRLSSADARCTVDGATTLTVSDNLTTGIFLDGGSQLTIEDGAKVLITRNHAEQENCTTKKDLAQCGGGIVVRSEAAATLSAATEVYNNHALLAGDDIYVEDGGTIAFGEVGSGWVLDDCDHAITGWYYDGYEPQEDAEALTTRWNVVTAMGHSCVPEREAYYHEYTVPETPACGLLALKAAHGYINDTPYVPPQVSYYTVTVRYLDKDTGAELAPRVTTERKPAGSYYDVKEYDRIAIEGYDYDSATGDPLTGTLNANKQVTVYYVKAAEPEPEPEPPVTPPDSGSPETGEPEPPAPLDPTPDTGKASDTSLAVLLAALFALAGTGAYLHRRRVRG